MGARGGGGGGGRWEKKKKKKGEIKFFLSNSKKSILVFSSVKVLQRFQKVSKELSGHWLCGNRCSGHLSLSYFVNSVQPTWQTAPRTASWSAPDRHSVCGITLVTLQAVLLHSNVTPTNCLVLGHLQRHVFHVSSARCSLQVIDRQTITPPTCEGFAVVLIKAGNVNVVSKRLA